MTFYLFGGLFYFNIEKLLWLLFEIFCWKDEEKLDELEALEKKLLKRRAELSRLEYTGEKPSSSGRFCFRLDTFASYCHLLRKSCCFIISKLVQIASCLMIQILHFKAKSIHQRRNLLLHKYLISWMQRKRNASTWELFAMHYSWWCQW